MTPADIQSDFPSSVQQTNQLILAFQRVISVSYTHLDVYKRQVYGKTVRGDSDPVDSSGASFRSGRKLQVSDPSVSL